MNDYKIFLIDKDGSYAQLELESLDFSTTFSINDIKDISKRKDTISKNIKILGTKNNNRVLGNLFNLNRSVSAGSSINLNYNFKANNQTDCIIYENNMVVLKGSLQIIEVSKNENGEFIYNAVVTGAVVNFFQKIKDLSLDELDFGTATHQFNLNTIYNSWDNNFNYPFIYPSIDYGVLPKYSNNYDFRNFRCGLYLKTYFDAIFGSFGFTYTSNFTNTDIFKKAFIPYPEKSFNKIIKAPYFTGFTSSGGHYLTTTSGNVDSEPILFSATSNSYVSVETAKNENNSDVQSFKFTRNLSTTGSLHINNLKVSNEEGSALGRVAVYPVLANNTVNYSNPIAFRDISVYNSEIVINDFTLQLPFADYPENSEFTVMCAALGTYGTSRLRFVYTGATLTFGDNNTISNAEIQQGDLIKLNDIVPQGFNVYTLLTDILKLFNLYLTENPNKINDFIIEDYNTFYNKTKQPKLNALNWSNKLDNDELLTSFNLVIPKKYRFSFKEDGSDYWAKEYKSKYNDLYGNALISNDTGYSEESKIEINFSSTLLVRAGEDNKVMPNIFTGNITAREQYKSNLRLLFNNGTGSTTNYTIAAYKSGGTVTYASNVGYYNNSSHLLKDDDGNYIFNLQFGTPNEVFFPVTADIFTIPNLYTEYYKGQITELIDPNFSTFECRMWLNEGDISNLDFTTPIYINTEEWGNAYFKLLQVDYKTSKELSKVKLQKIII